MEKPGFSHHRRVIWVVLVFVVIGGVIVISNWQDIERVLSKADWRYLPGALIFTFVSYIFYSMSFSLFSRMIGINMRWRDLSEICFVTTVLNHIVTTGGVAGYSIRYLLMNHYGIMMRDVLTASLIHYYLTSLDMLGMLPVSLVYLLLNTTVPPALANFLLAMTIVLAGGAMIAAVILFRDSLRIVLVEATNRIVYRIFQRDLSGTLAKYNESFSHGALVLREQPKKSALLILMILVDFISSIIVLGFCFEALGASLKFGDLLVGYVIGIMAGVISMVPGGMGVQEGSMAGVFVLLGVPFEQAILAAILFRVIYYFVPYLVSLFFYWRILSRQLPSLSADRDGNKTCVS